MPAWCRAALVAAMTSSCLLALPGASRAASAAADLSASVGPSAAVREAQGLPPAARPADDLPAIAGADARWTIDWVRRHGDAHGQPFAVVDKQGAHLYVFDAAGRLAGHVEVLTGLARGDGSVPGIGQRPVHLIRPFERTTPAGRFASRPGSNLAGDRVVWVDYDTGIALHRLRPGASEAVRARSLASPTPEDNRQSFGCVVVPPAFFDAVVLPVLGRSPGVVYVMPDERSAQALFEGGAAVTASAGGGGGVAAAAGLSAATRSPASR